MVERGYTHHFGPKLRNRAALVIQAQSAGFDSGNFAKITINGEEVAMPANEHGHFRGLHVVGVNYESAKVDFAQVFDTYDNSKEFDKFIASK